MSRKSSKSKRPEKYTIIAIITKITSEGKVVLNGVGKHRYENSKGEILNLLENKEKIQDLKLLELDKTYVIEDKGAVTKTLLAMAMLNKKPLKLAIECSDSKVYSITAVEVP